MELKKEKRKILKRESAMAKAKKFLGRFYPPSFWSLINNNQEIHLW